MLSAVFGKEAGSQNPQGTSMGENPYAPQKKAQATTTGASAGSVANPSGFYGNYGISGPTDFNGGGFPLWNVFNNLSRYEYPLLGEQAQFGASLEPGREQSIQALINALSPAGVQAQIGAFGNQANENAGKSAQYASAQNAAQGLSPAYSAGNTAAAFNNAANQTNQYSAQLNSPEAMQQRLQALLGAYGQGQMVPILQQLLQLSGPTQQQQQINMQGQQSGGGALGGLGGILGSVLGGGGLGSLFSMLGLGGGGSSPSFGTNGGSPNFGNFF